MSGFIYNTHYNLMYHHCLISQIHDEKNYIDAHTETYVESRTYDFFLSSWTIERRMNM